jgi:hypothetical protein
MTDDGIKVEPGFRESARLDLGMPMPTYASRLDISSPQGRAEIKKAVDACRERGLIRFPGDRAMVPAPVSPSLPKHTLAADNLVKCKTCGRLVDTQEITNGQ